MPICYGLPLPATVELWREGKVELGGCTVPIGAPKWHCEACGHKFGRADE